jgi:hypothetical protein
MNQVPALFIEPGCATRLSHNAGFYKPKLSRKEKASSKEEARVLVTF